jgi:predicted MFS family arabinose efflux permease
VELLRDPSIASMALTVICFGATMFSIVFFLPIYLQLAQGSNPSESGLLLLPVTIGIVCGSTTTGRLIARTGRPNVLPVAGLVLAGSALGLLALLPLQRWVLAVLGFFCGIGLGTVMPTAQVVVQSLAGRARLGAAAALVTLSRATGAAIGTAVFGAVIFALLPGNDPARVSALAHQAVPDPAIAFAFRVGFGCAAVVALAGAFMASRLRRIHL